ncbi:DNA-binding transcriptional regulator, LysR family [Amycolatopsis marina]|uniref:DNA-binding transcriptional regulator, LysR family n=1 Tax=Amycolatopsis marina TaxID=490629 RepID=A0A1I0X0S0_9PSEU|nr:LysR family transcriptional regulator [Amycolatopsis marina]SFA93723.1 DNA-binding transcriptional regulator, LysR family [Amycolatopsis marina]
MTIELRHFRCFLAIAEEGNVTRAAGRLHLTQPAVSRTLRQLEQQLGLRLVDRSTHHLRLTDDGLAFRDKAATVVAAADDALDTRRLRSWPLRMGHAWAAAGAFTSTLLRRWEHAHPDTPLELLRIDDRTAGLTTGQVDVALLRGVVDAPGLVVEPLLTEPRVAAMPADSPLAERAELSLADFTDQTVAVNTISGVTTPHLWPPEIRPARTMTVANTDDWLAAIAANRAVGITTSATSDLHRYPGVVYRPMVDAPEIPVVLAWRRMPGHPAIPTLVALFRDVVGEGRTDRKPDKS